MKKPLMIGDRLDTDIRGGVGFGIDTACVMTGIATRKELLAAKPEDRPTYIIPDLKSLFEEYESPRPSRHGGKLGNVEVEIVSNKVRVTKGDARSLEALKIATELIWSSPVPIYGLDVEAGLYE